MKKLLLLYVLLLALQAGFSQVPRQSVRNVADIKGAIVKQEQGDYTDPKTKKPTGHYTIVYIIDTIKHHLLNVSITTTDTKRELIYLYYYDQNKLQKASSGIVQDGYTIIQSTYDYDADDANISDKDLQAFSQTDEKYALLKESKRYLAVLKR